jgi:DNA topoisomerase-3
LLKSAELTGIWERKLRQIEKGEYDPKTFLDEMKEMVSKLVAEVKLEQHQKIEIEQSAEEKKTETEENPEKSVPEKPVDRKREEKVVDFSTLICPKCKKGRILKGNTAYGCSEYKVGCTFKVLFEQYGKKLTDKQIFTLIQKGKSPKITGLMVNGQKVDGVLVFDEGYKVVVEE